MRKILLDLFMIPKIMTLGSSRKYTCVHAIEESAFLAVLLQRWHRAPVLYDMQSSLPDQLSRYKILRWTWCQRVLRAAERWLLRRVDRIVCSAGLATQVVSIVSRDVVSEWKFPGQSYSVSEQEKTSFRSRFGIETGSSIVMYAGNFEAYQGLSLLIDALPAVFEEFPDALAIFVGGEKLSKNQLGDHGAHLIQEGRLRLVPRQPKSEMPRILAVADVVVSPRAYGDNVGLKVFDYMTAGKPIVATDIAAHRSILDESRALLVNAEDGVMGQAIVQLLRSPEYATRLGEAAKSYAVTNMSREIFEEQVTRLYGARAERDATGGPLSGAGRSTCK